jgi:hypothetical protein
MSASWGCGSQHAQQQYLPATGTALLHPQWSSCAAPLAALEFCRQQGLPTTINCNLPLDWCGRGDGGVVQHTPLACADPDSLPWLLHAAACRTAAKDARQGPNGVSQACSKPARLDEAPPHNLWPGVLADAAPGTGCPRPANGVMKGNCEKNVGRRWLVDHHQKTALHSALQHTPTSLCAPAVGHGRAEQLRRVRPLVVAATWGQATCGSSALGVCVPSLSALAECWLCTRTHLGHTELAAPASSVQGGRYSCKHVGCCCCSNGDAGLCCTLLRGSWVGDGAQGATKVRWESGQSGCEAAGLRPCRTLYDSYLG